MWLPLLVLLGLIILYRWHRQRQVLGNLSEKYVFITGCDTGFGRQLAKQLDGRGMKVLAACLTEVGATELKKETSSRLQTVILNVADSKSVSAAVKWVADTVTNKGLWGLVNNAGILIPVCPSEWVKKEDFQKIIDVNLLGMVDVTINLLNLIRKSKGRIVNVSSIAGRISFCSGGYSISKFGVEAFSDNLRRELKQFGVKVSVIAPDFFKTNILIANQIKENVTNTWKKLPMSLRNDYGEDYYRNYCKFVDVICAKSSTKLTIVTDCMEHALTAQHPWTRYSAGPYSKFFYMPLSYLPTCVTDYILGS
ncbi:retinol dehydrogenase 7-like isoform 1-T3 [Anomaloglossus baeobatrachus]|uniref:retinol dehydrogenase 7-like n=1 Tax=Anomaloglossus baeobatrachus TaxID=238106 RepID=UPI003F50A8C3